MDYGIFLWKYIEFHTKKIILKIKVVTTVDGEWRKYVKLDIHLKIKVVTTKMSDTKVYQLLDIHLKIKAVTTYNEFQRYIVKIK